MWLSRLGVALLALGASPARAEGEPDWLESYRAPSACPAASSFREQVEQRLSRAREALGRARVRVTLSRGGASETERGQWRSELTIGGDAQPVTSTQVADASCAALVQALALVVALQVDAVPAASTPAGTTPAASTPAATAPAFSPAGPDDAQVAPPLDQRVEPASPTSGSKPLQLGAGVRASVLSPLGPEPALGWGAAVTLEWAARGAWSPRFELSASRLATGEVALAGGTAMRFDALLAGASVCPLRGLGTAGFWLRPCLDLEAGQLTGRGGGRALARSEQRRTPWLAPGASLRAAVIPLGGPIQLSAGFGASFPLYRHEFYFAPNIEGFSVPRAGWNGSGQAAWLF